MRLHRQHHHPQHRAEPQHQQQPFRDSHIEVAAAIVGVPFVSLGAAGEQFLEQTPWANPNHPAHRQMEGGSAPLYAGPPGNRRHSHQPGGGNSNPFLNGEAMHKSQSAAGHAHEMLKGAKMGVDMGVKREPVSHVV